MRAALKALTSWAVLLVAAFAGCVDAPEGLEGRERGPRGPFLTTFSVRDAVTAVPIFLARVSVLGERDVLLGLSTDRGGNATVEVPAEATGYEVAADGYFPVASNFTRVAATVLVRLKPVSNATEVYGASSGLQFRKPVDLGSKNYLFAIGTSCLTEDLLGDRDGDCGLSEPSIEVDSRGVIYVTGTCCIGNAPPLYVSRDGGAKFQEMRTPGIREAFGIEADLAIDGKGVIYMADIELAATFQVTAWSPDGTYLRHMKWPAPPLVDRDWIRAEGDGKLYYVYNTGSSTNVYTSTDGGMTWSPRPVFSGPYALGNPVQGPNAGELWVLGGSMAGKRRADYTKDGGTTWTSEATSTPTGVGFPTGAFDEGGNLYATGGSQESLQIAFRDPTGVWHPPTQFTPPLGRHRMPWIAAGAEGKVAVAWYGTLEDGPQAKWFLFVAASRNANQPNSLWQVAIADPEPILLGTLQRQLLDFLQAEIGPDGSIHVSYAKLRPTEPNNEEKLHYVRSEPMPEMARQKYHLGP